MMFAKGDRVVTPLGAGAVAYARMAPPEYVLPVSYSVVLDAKKAESEKPPFPAYSGTVFPADQVQPLNRKKLEALVWKHTHRDFKGRTPDGVRTVMQLVPGQGTCIVALAKLSDDELVGKLLWGTKLGQGSPQGNK
jgi:hypothetical protein